MAAISSSGFRYFDALLVQDSRHCVTSPVLPVKKSYNILNFELLYCQSSDVAKLFPIYSSSFRSCGITKLFNREANCKGDSVAFYSKSVATELRSVNKFKNQKTVDTMREK